MQAKQFMAGSVVGGVVLFVTGYLIFNVAFADFYTANAGSAAGVDRSALILWPIALASLAYAALITYSMGNRTDAMSIGGGAKVGAIVGFLLWFSVDFFLYGATNIANMTRTVVDPVLELVHGGIAGAVIAAVLVKMSGPGRNAT